MSFRIGIEHLLDVIFMRKPWTYFVHRVVHFTFEMFINAHEMYKGEDILGHELLVQMISSVRDVWKPLSHIGRHTNTPLVFDSLVLRSGVDAWWKEVLSLMIYWSLLFAVEGLAFFLGRHPAVALLFVALLNENYRDYYDRIEAKWIRIFYTLWDFQVRNTFPTN